MLTVITVFLFIVTGGLEWVRAQILITASTRLDQLLGPRVFDGVFARTLATGGRVASAQPLNDLLVLPQFLTGNGLFAFFDAPWVPVYIFVMFMFHPAFGVVAVLSALVLVALTVWGEAATKADLDKATQLGNETAQQTQHHLRNAEAVAAMGMLPSLGVRWQQQQAAVRALQVRSSRRGGMIAMLSRVFRMTIQSLILGLGAWLAIHKEITPGLLIAGSILLGRALSPLDLMISGWRGFVAARAAFRRLDALLGMTAAGDASMELPSPAGELRLEKATITPPGAPAPVLKGLNMDIPTGTLLGVIGPSGAGKSTFARAVLGLYAPVTGSVRLDGADVSQWERERLGPHVGYLPQDVELLDGTVSENIARFGPVQADAVVQAAHAAGVHDLILRLPEGYDTPLVNNAGMLSAGQRQRIALARALYGDPRLIVLDEPNANLDQEGEAALAETLRALKEQGRTVVFITHRSSLLEQADRIALLVDGQLARFGPRDTVLASLRAPVASLGAPSGGPGRVAVAGG